MREVQNRQDEEILDRNGLSIALLPESHDDIIKAKTTQFSGVFPYLNLFCLWDFGIDTIRLFYDLDPVLEQAQKRKLEVTASSIFEPRSSRKESKKTKVSALAAKDKVAQLSAMAQVNTKLKIDPFLRSDSVVSKPDNVRSKLGIVKRKNTMSYAEASGSSESGNAGEEVDESIDEEVMQNSSHSQRERAADGNSILLFYSYMQYNRWLTGSLEQCIFLRYLWWAQTTIMTALKRVRRRKRGNER